MMRLISSFNFARPCFRYRLRAPISRPRKTYSSSLPYVHHADLVAHAILANHRPRMFVAAGMSSPHRSKYAGLISSADASAPSSPQYHPAFPSGGGQNVLLRQLHRRTQRLPARNDRDLVPADACVRAFMFTSAWPASCQAVFFLFLVRPWPGCGARVPTGPCRALPPIPPCPRFFIQPCGQQGASFNKFASSAPE